MAIAVRDNTSFAVEIEDTEGTYKPPQSADSYVQTLKDGSEMTRSQELLQREIFTGSIGKTQSRLGTRSVSGAMPVELRAGELEGDAPEADKLYTSAMGAKKTRASVVTKTGNSASVLQIEDADIGDFSRYDIILVKEAGSYELSWVSAVDTTPAAANITLGKTLGFVPSNNVEIAAVTQYSTANSGHPSLSVSKYIEAAKLENAVGCKVTSMSLENFTTGQIPSVNFGFEGLSFDSKLELPAASQVEQYSFVGLTGADFDVNGPGLYFEAADDRFYVWLNVTDGPNTQSDPAPFLLGLQVNILMADTATQIVNKIITVFNTVDLVVAGLDDILAAGALVETSAGVLQITYEPQGLAESGSAGTSGTTHSILVTGNDVIVGSPFTPDYDSTLPPIALRACLYQEGTDLQVNDFSLSLENTLGFVTSTCSENGRISSRVTERSITGSFNPYKNDNDLVQFDKFKCNTPYTLFVYAFNPELDANCEFTGEFSNAVAILLTNCITTELGESDADGLLVEDITFEATRGASGTDEELKIAFM